MNMLQAQSKKDNTFRYYIDGKRVNRSTYIDRELIARIRGYAFHSFVTTENETSYLHRYCID